jgi:hypothetical protein
LTKNKKKSQLHVVFVNKKTGKTASSNGWLLGLAAQFFLIGDDSGIASLLPNQKVHQLLKKNRLELKEIRGLGSDRAIMNVALQAKIMLPCMAAIFEEKLSRNASTTKGKFCTWVAEQVKDQSSEIYKIAADCEFYDLLESPRSERWWRDQLKRQS